MNGVTDVRCPAVSMIPETPTIRLLWQTVLLFITQATAKGWEDMISLSPVTIPNNSKQTYNYEAMDQQQMIRLAQIHSLKETWKDKKAVAEAQQRLEAAMSHKPQERRIADFEFVIDDNTTYYLLKDFKSAKAKQLFQRYQQMEKDYRQQEEKLNSMRLRYATGNKQEKTILTPAILDLEKRILQMSGELDALEINVRNAEKTK